jgi:hypothetical protein
LACSALVSISDRRNGACLHLGQAFVASRVKSSFQAVYRNRRRFTIAAVIFSTGLSVARPPVPCLTDGSAQASAMTIQRPTLPSTAIPVQAPAGADDAAHHDRASEPSGSGVLQATGRLRGLPARDPGAFAQPRQAAASGPSSSSAAQPTFRLLPAHRFKAPAPPRPKLPFDRERALHFFPELTRYLDEVEFAYLMNETQIPMTSISFRN